MEENEVKPDNLAPQGSPAHNAWLKECAERRNLAMNEPACGHVDTWMFDQLEVLGFDGPNGEDMLVFDGKDGLDWKHVRGAVLQAVKEKLGDLDTDTYNAIWEALHEHLGVSGIIVKCQECEQTFCIST